MKKRAFSLIELSIVILIIGVAVIGIISGSIAVNKAKLSSATSLTSSSSVNSIPGTVVWLETASEKSFLQNEAVENSLISTWYDINSQGASEKYNATQSTSSKRPKYVSNGINGLPAINFDGSDFLTAGRVILADSSHSVFIVEARNSETAGYIFGGGSATTPYLGGVSFGYKDSTNLLHTVKNSSGAIGHKNLPIPSFSKPITRILTIICRNSGIKSEATVYLNGSGYTSSTQINTVIPASVPNYHIGSAVSTSNSYKGNIGEFIVFNRALSSEERQSVEEYLAKKWGVKL